MVASVRRRRQRLRRAAGRQPTAAVLRKHPDGAAAEVRTDCDGWPCLAVHAAALPLLHFLPDVMAP